MLIRNAEIQHYGNADVRIGGDRIEAIGRLSPVAGEAVLDAEGGALLPGLHDHHIHLAGLAVRRDSVWCGPPDVTTLEELGARLNRPGAGWIRGIGFHESVAGGLPSARELDRLVSGRPVRVQHRSGRMWLLNSLALERLLAHAAPPPGLERDVSGFTGRLFDEDPWLRQALGSRPPDFAAVSSELARHGVTGLTDMSPRNDAQMAEHFAQQMLDGALVQHCLLAGELSLAHAAPGPWQLGPAKLHLHEAAFPDFDEATRFLRNAHEQGRAVAIHCVTEAELVFALAALKQAGPVQGDRIEHASVASMELVQSISDLGLAVCTQSHFVAERGNRYLLDVEPRHLDDLYRLRSFLLCDVPLAGGSDAPFGSANPWEAMAAAVDRKTREGQDLGCGEALTPEEALSLYLAEPDNLRRQRQIVPDAPADLCLLDRPWREARRNLRAVTLQATIISGRLVHNGIDQAPVQSSSDT